MYTLEVSAWSLSSSDIFANEWYPLMHQAFDLYVECFMNVEPRHAYKMCVYHIYIYLGYLLSQFVGEWVIKCGLGIEKLENLNYLDMPWKKPGYLSQLITLILLNASILETKRGCAFTICLCWFYDVHSMSSMLKSLLQSICTLRINHNAHIYICSYATQWQVHVLFSKRTAKTSKYG